MGRGRGEKGAGRSSWSPSQFYCFGDNEPASGMKKKEEREEGKEKKKEKKKLIYLINLPQNSNLKKK